MKSGDSRTPRCSLNTADVLRSTWRLRHLTADMNTVWVGFASGNTTFRRQPRSDWVSPVVEGQSLAVSFAPVAQSRAVIFNATSSSCSS